MVLMVMVCKETRVITHTYTDNLQVAYPIIENEPAILPEAALVANHSNAGIETCAGEPAS